MKKFVATIFLFIYFIGTSGATIRLHYCMDKLQGWSLTSKERSKCDKCGMDKQKQKGCCHDESKFVKLDKDHKATFNDFDFTKVQIAGHNIPASIGALYAFNPVIALPVNNAPPIERQVPTYLFNSVFRI